MLATIEKTVTDTVMEPTVTYDKKNSKIIATVIVSLSPGGESLSITAPFITIPGPGSSRSHATWIVVWELVPSSDLLKVSFNADRGIVLPPNSSLPADVKISNSARMGNAEYRWTTTIKNWMKKNNKNNSFNYDIYVLGSPHRQAGGGADPQCGP